MKPSDAKMARQLIVARIHGFALIPFLRLRAKSYVLYSAVAVAIQAVLALSGLWFALDLVVAFFLGVFFVYIRWLRGMRKSWPFLSRVTNWDEVTRISEDESSD